MSKTGKISWTGYTSLERSEDIGFGLSEATLLKLADADAFRSIGLDRRQALWELSAMADHAVTVFSKQSNKDEDESNISFPEMIKN